jgi:hypothetical protein
MVKLHSGISSSTPKIPGSVLCVYLSTTPENTILQVANFRSLFTFSDYIVHVEHYVLSLFTVFRMKRGLRHQHLNWMTDFHRIWYKRCAIGGHPNVVHLISYNQ